jgi:hypothetical protein
VIASGSTAFSSSLLELLLGCNHYLPRAPKELLWHQHLSHASLMTIHNLINQTCPGSTPSSEDLIPPDQRNLLEAADVKFTIKALHSKMVCSPHLTVFSIARCSISINLSLALVAIIRMVF